MLNHPFIHDAAKCSNLWANVHTVTESRDPAVLTSDLQKGVEAVEWRPNGGSTLSVACRSFLL